MVLLRKPRSGIITFSLTVFIVVVVFYAPLRAQTPSNPNPIVIKSGDLSIEITKDDVEITEAYNGATWSDDSQNVYFSKYVNISISRERIDQIEEYSWSKLAEKAQKLKPEDRGKEATLQQMEDKLPRSFDFENPLYEKVLFFRYNLSDKKIDLIAAENFQTCGWPTVISFGDSIVNNRLEYGDCNGMRAIDLTTFKTTTLGDADSFFRSPNFRTKNMVSVQETFPYTFRFLSPNRHAFIQFKHIPNSNFRYDNRSGFTPQADIIGIFLDPSVRLATLEELGWRGGVPPMHMITTLNRYKPQYFVALKSIRSPEEREIRKRIGIE